MPSMEPKGVESGHPEVYSKLSPGWRFGCSPTTPGPRTSSMRPVASRMIQCREISLQGRSLSLEMRMV